MEVYLIWLSGNHMVHVNVIDLNILCSYRASVGELNGVVTT